MCMYASVRKCVGCMWLATHTRVHMPMYACRNIFICVSISGCMHCPCMNACICPSAHVCVCMYMYAHMYLHAHVCVCRYMPVCVCIWIYVIFVCICICVCISICVYYISVPICFACIRFCMQTCPHTLPPSLSLVISSA